MLNLYKQIKYYLNRVNEDHVSAYAAQSAFFMMLSLVPIILLLMMLVRYTPITQSDIMEVAYRFFPKTIRNTIIALVNESYSHTGTTISLTALVVLWASGKGIMAVTNGLNTIRNLEETRNYIILRIRSAIYTLLFLMSVIVVLAFWSFGDNKILTMGFLMILILCVYQFLPNQRSKWIMHIPGTIFSAVGWSLVSFVISIYMDLFKGFSNVYGSLTTIVLIMLWLYFCMYILLLGGEINDLLEEYLDNQKHSR